MVNIDQNNKYVIKILKITIEHTELIKLLLNIIIV